MNQMDNLGCGKAHSEFRDIFSLTTRGVAFAMVGFWSLRFSSIRILL